MTACKKPLCGILAFILVFVFIAAVPISVFAEDAEEGTFSVNEIEKNRKLDEKTGLYYLQTAADPSALQIVGYEGTDTEVKIPTKIDSLTVVAIGDNAFAGNTSVEVVKLHNDVTIIGKGAFKGCTALKEIKSAKSLATIGEGAFEGCKALTEFKIADAVTDIPARCFADCTALNEIDVHKNIKNVAKDAFVGTAWENAKEDGVLSFGRVLYSYKGNLKNIEIPKGVSIIEDYAFIGNTDLETITFGPDVEEIGLYAFQNCVNLREVNVDDAMGIVSAGAFKGCTALKSIDFSNATLATIGYESFADCTSLETVGTSETLSEIGDYAFANTKIKTIKFYKNVNSVTADAFAGVKTLESFEVVDNNKEFSATDGVLYNKKGTSIIAYPAAKKGDFAIPQGVSSIADRAFKDSVVANVTVAEDASLDWIGVSAFENSAITSFEVPANVTKINNATFKNATKLSKIVFNDGLTYICASAFDGCTALTGVELPATLQTVATGAFKNAGLKSVKVGDGVAQIAAEAFAGNKALADVTLGNNVAKIGKDAFKDCVLLKKVSIPASVVDFSAASFTGCTALVTIAVDGKNTTYKSVGSAVYSLDGTELVVAGNAKSTTIAIAEGTKVIAANAFDLATNAIAIAFPSTLVNVEADALDVTSWYNTALGVVYAGSVLYKVKGEIADVVVAEGVKTIADGAVKNPAVKNVTLPSTLVEIGKGAFEGAGVAAVVIPDSVTAIASGAFRNCAALATVKLSKNLETMGAGAFAGCTALKEIAIPAKLKVLSSDAFAGCTALAKVNLGAVEEIEQYAFEGCIALTEITLPATVAVCEVLAFEDCTALAKFVVAEGNKAYSSTEDGVVLSANDEGVFNTIAIYPAGKKGAYAVPAEVTAIADKAFYNCDALTAITFAEGFDSIGNEAFFDCDSIKSIIMPESARNIGDHAFASCDNLRFFQVKSNLTVYADNVFDGCYYYNYDAVDIDVEDNYGVIIGVIVGVFAVIGVVWYLVYSKKQKKIQKEILEKNAIAEELAAMKEKEAEEAKKAEETV